MLAPDAVWPTLQREAREMAEREPLMGGIVYSHLLNHRSFEGALGFLLSHKLATASVCATQWNNLLADVLAPGGGVDGRGGASGHGGAAAECRDVGALARQDLVAIRARDPACPSLAHAMVFFKGFAGVQAHRCAHELWLRGKTAAACLIQSRVSEAFGMDVHPAATIGPGFMVDHATGVVIGETAVVGRDVTMLHAVTLGGTGKERGRRHPSVGDGVFIGAGASLLGCIKVGAQAKIGAGTTVVRDVPPGATIVGVVGVQVKKRRGAAGAGAGASDHVADDSLLFDMAGSSGLRERLSELVLLRRRGAGGEPSGDGRAGSASEAEKDAGAGGGGGAKSPRRGLFAAARPRAKL